MTSVQTHVDGGIGSVVLDRPQQYNAVTLELGHELEQALLDLGARQDVSAIAIRGAGGNFCAGGDFNEVERLRAGGAAGLRPLFANFAAVCRAIVTVPVPVVAVVEGVAMAGGFELMQAADIALVRDDARISDNHIRYGQVPGGGSTQRLPRLVSRQQALGLLLSGEHLDGREAVRLGLAFRSWPAETFDRAVADFLATLAGRRRDALTSIKRLVYDGLSTSLTAGLEDEMTTAIEHIAGQAGGDGVSAFFTRSSRP